MPLEGRAIQLSKLAPSHAKREKAPVSPSNWPGFLFDSRSAFALIGGYLNC